MSTNATISRMNADKTISTIYLHWDGDLDGAGKVLKEHYSDPAKVDELIALGDLSSLGEEIGTKHDFDDRPDGKVCFAYGRDRGENNTVAHKFRSLAELDDERQKYNYLFKDGEWQLVTDRLSLMTF